MGKEVNKLESTTAIIGEGCETLVVLNVYDLTPLNHYSYWFGFGIFHSGIEVHGMEYGFGAHDFAASGVFEVEPRSCPGFIYRCSIPLGRINMPPSEFRAFIEGVTSEYHGDTYHLITKNCNHFTDDMAFRLTGKRIPGWVNRLARAGALCSCLLPESLQVTTVKQFPEYHECIGKEGYTGPTYSRWEPGIKPRGRGLDSGLEAEAVGPCTILLHSPVNKPRATMHIECFGRT